MKIYIMLMLTLSLYANTTNRLEENNEVQTLIKEKINKKSKIKNLLDIIKKYNLKSYNVNRDYFEAKTCNKNIEENISIHDILSFSETKTYEILMKLKNNESIITKAYYNSLISAYRFMNCDEIDDLGKYIGSVSAVSVETEFQSKIKGRKITQQ